MRTPDFWCMDCNAYTQLDEHLRCTTCKSDSVISTQLNPQPKRDARTALAKHLYSLLDQVEP